jgi:enoyl-CoA hydratase/carnithine racemase
MDGEIGIVRLEGPRGNPLPDPVWCPPAELRAFLEDERVKAAVVCGSGPHFCVGADLKTLEQRISSDLSGFGQRLAVGKDLLDVIWLGPVPVCAAIRGSCLGAGLEIALACHFRVAATTSLLGLPESSLGLLPGLGGAVQSGARLCRRAAMDLLLSGRMVGAHEALEIGLVDELAPAQDVERSATQRLERLVAGRSKAQVRAVMEVLCVLETKGREAALLAETAAFLELARAPRPSQPG